MLHARYHPNLVAHQVVKFHEATLFSSKGIKKIRTLHLRSIFDRFCKNLLGVVCVSNPWPFCSACKNFGAQHPIEAKIWSSKKVDLVGTTAPSNLLGW